MNAGLSGYGCAVQAREILLATGRGPSVTPERGVTSFTAEAHDALQEAAESYIVGIFKDTLLEAIHAKRVTMRKEDMQLAQRVRREVA